MLCFQRSKMTMYINLAKRALSIKDFSHQEFKRAFYFANTKLHKKSRDNKNVIFCGYTRKNPSCAVTREGGYMSENFNAETYWIINNKYYICESITPYTYLWTGETTKTNIRVWPDYSDKKIKIPSDIASEITTFTSSLASERGNYIDTNVVLEMSFGSHFMEILRELFDDIPENHSREQLII